jgi:hypothetical protein
MDVQLSKAINDANSFSEILYRRRFKNDLRSRVVAACLAVSQQHHNSVLILLSRKPPLESSSFALLRPLVESVIRGLWLNHVATDAQVDEYARSGTKLDMASMMKKLDEVTGLNSHQGLYKKNWSVLSAYTHTGELQVQRWLTTRHVEPKYSKEEVLELIELSGLVAGLAFQTLSAISLEPATTDRGHPSSG